MRAGERRRGLELVVLAVLALAALLVAGVVLSFVLAALGGD